MANPAVLAASTMASAITHGEAWRRDHHEVQACWRIEDHLALCNLTLFPSLFEIIDYWNSDDRFSRFTSEADECHFEGALQRALRSCDSILSAIRGIEDMGHALDGADLFRANHARLSEAVRETERIAKLEARMGYRGVTVDPVAAEAFKAMVESPSDENPRPTFETKPVSLAK